MKKSQKKVLRTIIALSQRPKITLTRLCVQTDLSITTIRRCIDELENEGLIRAIRPHSGVPYEFDITDQAYETLNIKRVV